MYVLCTQPGKLLDVPYSAGAVLEIPHEYYDPANMARLGPNLTSAQQAVLVSWSALSPGWPWPLNAE